MTDTWPHIVCDSCNNEFDVTPIGDSETVEVKYCPFCGEALDNDMDFDSITFDDYPEDD